MVHDARAIANYFLDLAREDNQRLDPLGIQKHVYYAHGWNLAIRKEPLVRQPIEAWDYGPVISDLYHTFREFGSRPITRPARKVRFDPDTFAISYIRPVLKDDSPAKALLEKVWKVYGKFSSIQLSNMTHEPDSPWAIARQKRYRKIPNYLIEEYFVGKAREHSSKT